MAPLESGVYCKREILCISLVFRCEIDLSIYKDQYIGGECPQRINRILGEMQ